MKIQFNIWNVVFVVAIVILTVVLVRQKYKTTEYVDSIIQDKKEVLQKIEQMNSEIVFKNNTIIQYKDTVELLKQKSENQRRYISSLEKRRDDKIEEATNTPTSESYAFLQALTPPEDTLMYPFAGNQVKQLHVNEIERGIAIEEVEALEAYVFTLEDRLELQEKISNELESQIAIRESQIAICKDELEDAIKEIKRVNKIKSRSNAIMIIGGAIIVTLAAL